MKLSNRIVAGIAVCAVAFFSLGSLVNAAENTSPLISNVLADYQRTEGKFTIGLDMLSIGKVNKDAALGFPKSAIGVNAGLGITWRNYITKLSANDVAKVAEEVLKQNPTISEPEFRQALKTKINKKWFTYWGLNTVFLMVPGAEFGATYDLTNADGAGLSIDVGGSIIFLIPTPSIGLTYTF